MQLIETKKTNMILNIAKISIILFMAIFLIGFFFPFYEYPNDSKVYAYLSMRIFEDSYEYTNEFLHETGYWEFVPAALVKTQDNSAIPNILPLFPALVGVFYEIFGYYALFYINPILTIIFLIVSERFATNYFNKYVGLFVLIFLVTNEMTFWTGRGLLTETLFAIVFLMGL